MKKTIGIVGNGVVGSATGKAFAAKGFEVKAWDLIEERSPYPLKEVLDTQTVFVCLPTPSMPSGACDVSHLLAFFTDAQVDASKNLTTFVIRSTVPVGFTRDVHVNHHFPSVYHWPEFLTMRTADQDALNPRASFLGKPGNDWYRDEVVQTVFGEFQDWPRGCLLTSSDKTEAIKLLMNAWLAIKNATFNEFRLFTDALGLDWESVRSAMLTEGRIHPVQTEVPGPDGKRGFGGPCLPKDLLSYAHQCRLHRVPPQMAAAASAVNEQVRFGSSVDAV